MEAWRCIRPVRPVRFYEPELQVPQVLSILCHLQENFLQLMDHVAKLFASPQGLSAAIYTQVSDIEAEVNGKSVLYLTAVSPVHDQPGPTECDPCESLQR